MSLAGPRVKQRLGHDPRNSQWAANKDGFGQRLMAKMGWAEGRGLGAREDGVKSHVKVHLKNDQLGIGAKRSSNDNWLENVSAFDQLLSNLNQAVAADAEPKATAAPAAATALAAAARPVATQAGTGPLPAKFETKRNGLYRKRLKHKDSRTYNAQEMLEIFATTKVTKLTAAAAAENQTAALDEAEATEAVLGFSGFRQHRATGGHHSDDDDDADASAAKSMPASAGSGLYSYFRRAAAEAEAKPAEPGAKPAKTKKKKAAAKGLEATEEPAVAEPQEVVDDGAPEVDTAVEAPRPRHRKRKRKEAAAANA